MLLASNGPPCIARVFAPKADAQRFLTEMENSKLKGAWTDPTLGRVLFRDWFGSGSGPRPGCDRIPRPGMSGCSGCMCSPPSGRCRWPASASVTCAPGWPA
jgi:hypothetical protein